MFVLHGHRYSRVHSRLVTFSRQALKNRLEKHFARFEKTPFIDRSSVLRPGQDVKHFCVLCANCRYISPGPGVCSRVIYKNISPSSPNRSIFPPPGIDLAEIRVSFRVQV